jgi:hypothetical protein
MDDSKTAEGAAKESRRKIVIRTRQGEVEVGGARHDRPGICPHCHRAIPLEAVTFEKRDGNGGTTKCTGREAAQKLGIAIGWEVGTAPNGTSQGQVGKCPYCHGSIPLTEVVFREGS